MRNVRAKFRPAYKYLLQSILDSVESGADIANNDALRKILLASYPDQVSCLLDRDNLSLIKFEVHCELISLY